MKKPGRKTMWSQTLLDDLVDIIISSDYYKKKLIFTNTKNQRNGEIYAKVLAELKERAKTRKEEVPFNTTQIRTKFKKINSECKGVALRIKTSTGVKRFIEEKDYGKWFNDLFAIVKTRDACRPELSVEPSCSEESSILSNEDQASTSSSAEIRKKLMINKPERKKKKQDVINETLNLIRSAIENDPTKEVLSFLKEESEKAREHELKMMQMLTQSSNTPQHHHQQQQQQQQPYNAQFYGYSCVGNNQNIQENTHLFNAQTLSQENVWQPRFQHH
jgi:hypothetical protein